MFGFTHNISLMWCNDFLVNNYRLRYNWYQFKQTDIFHNVETIVKRMNVYNVPVVIEHYRNLEWKTPQSI
jgi:hypothetical protein